MMKKNDNQMFSEDIFTINIKEWNGKGGWVRSRFEILMVLISSKQRRVFENCMITEG